VQISTESAGIIGPACAGPDIPICESIDKQTCINALRTAQGSQFRGQSDVIKVTSMKHRKLAAAARRATTEDAKRVLRALEEATQGRAITHDPIMERLRQCPEAFKVGEILGKAFDSLKYAQDGSEFADRYLPPSGTVIPPLV